MKDRTRSGWIPPLYRSELTVIIPTWNGRELMNRCLRSLEKGTHKPCILVVDDGSTDQTGEMLWSEFPSAGIVTLPDNQGFAKAANHGLLKVKTPFAALLNNDTEVGRYWAENILKGIRKYPEYGFFASRIINYYNPVLLDSAGDIYTRTGLPLKRGNRQPREDFSRDEPVLAASAGAAAYRMAALDKSGLLDESFHMYLEDVDLSLRLQSAGFPCMYLSSAVVKHREAASDPERNRNKTSMAFYSGKRVYWITRNRWLLMVTWQPLRNFPWLLYGWTKSLLFHMLKAGFAKEFLKGLKDGIKSSRAARRKRAEIKKTCQVPLSKLCKKYQK